MNPEQMLDMSAYEFDVACRNPDHPTEGKPASVVVVAPCKATHGFLCTACSELFVRVASYAPCTCGNLHDRTQFRFPLIRKTPSPGGTKTTAPTLTQLREMEELPWEPNGPANN